MTKDKLKELFAVECTETDGKGVTVIKGTPMDIINWINDKLDQETQRLKAELEREFCRGFEKATIKLRAEYEKVKAEKDKEIERLSDVADRNDELTESLNDANDKLDQLQSELTELKEKHKRDVVDFYMWMVENEHDHNIRLRVENKYEIYKQTHEND